MKTFWVLLSIIGLPVSAILGQENAYLSAEDSDPEATALLARMEEALSGHDALEIDFSITMTYPGEEPVAYSGAVQQQREKFFIEAGEMQIISDGQSRWIYDKESNAVSLYNANTSDGPQTPLEMLQIYKEGAYIYRMSGEGDEDGSPVRYIEFKPVDKTSELAKVRLTVRAKDTQPVRLELFEKGGINTNLQIHDIEPIDALPGTYYTFSTKDHPGIHVEDLRID